MSKKTGFHNFMIQSDPDNPTIHHIFMDGEEIYGIQQAIVIYNPQELPSVWLKMSTLRVDIDAPEAKVTEHSDTANEVKNGYTQPDCRAT